MADVSAELSVVCVIFVHSAVAALCKTAYDVVAVCNGNNTNE